MRIILQMLYGNFFSFACRLGGLLDYVLNRQICFAVIFLLSSLIFKSQTNYFQKTIGGNNEDLGRFIQQTSDGGFITIGSTKSYGSGAYDVYLVKTSVNGNVLWSKIFGGNNDDQGFSGQQTADGGYIITGYTASFGNGEDVLLIKTDNLGNLLWVKKYGSNNDERGYSVQQTSDLGYIIAGFTKSGFSAGAEDIYLIKTDVNGNVQWENAYGDNNPEFAYSVQQTSTGMFIVTGDTRSFGAGSQDVFLMKTNGAGGLLFFKTFGGANADFGYSVKQLSNGKYLIGGSTRSFGAGGDDMFLVNTDTLGLLQFSRTYGGGNNDFCYSVKETASGQFILGGSERSFGGGAEDAYLIKTNNTGGLIWSQSYGGGNNEYLNYVNQMSNGQFVLLGTTRTFGVGSDDFYLLRTDTVGKTGCNETSPVSLVTSPIIVTGNFPPVVTPGGVTNIPSIIVTSNFDLTTLLCQCIAPPNITGDAVICPGLTSTLAASGGTAYLWSTGATTSLITVSPTLTSIYSVTVSNGLCSDTASFKVSVFAPPVITINPSTATICSGASVLLTASGAISYAWSPIVGLSCGTCSSPTASPGSSTNYTVTGTDANGCTNTQTASVITTPLPTVSVSPPAPVICIGSTVTLTASGANNYGWSPATGLSCNNCPNPVANPSVTTTYTVTGTATTGCVNSQTITIVVNALPTISISPSSATLCAGTPTIYTASGANSYSWSPSAGLSCTNCASPSANSTVTTIYSVSGTDLNGCTNSKTATLVINPLPVLSISPASPTLCIGSSTVLTASGATAYTWSPATGLSCTNCANPTANPGVTTTYTVTGVNANGCLNTKTITVVINTMPVITITPATATICLGSTIVMTASGTNNYTWSPSTGLSCTNCPSPSASPTVNTTYTITGADAIGCLNTKTTTVSVNPLPLITISPATATICIGSSTLLTASGGTNYVWSPSTGLSCTNCANPTANPTVTTAYTITGTNANGCSNTKTVTVSVNPLPVISVSPASATICSGTSVLLSASGASSYSWSPATGLSCSACSSPTANPSASTIYTVTGTNANGCSNTQTTSVTTNSLPVITISPVSPSICIGSSVVLSATGANSYGWSPATALSCNNCPSPAANPVVNTSYTVSGTAANGCTNTKNITVFVNPLPIISVSPSSATFCVGGSTILTASGANNYSWSPSTGLSCTNCASPSANPTVTTTYTVSGTDLNGCVNTKTITITVNSLPVLNINPSTSTICITSSVVLNASGASTYTWLPTTGLSCTSCASPTANPSSTTVYTLTGISANGCMNTKTITISINPLPTISINPVSSTLCVGASTVLTASGANSYTWSPVASLSCSNCVNTTVSPTITTTYSVTGIDLNGCSNTATSSVLVNSLPVISITPSSATLCTGASGGLSASGAVSYSWIPAAGLSCTNCANPIAGPTVTTTYTVNGTNVNGCINTKTVTVSVNPLPIIAVSPSSPSICIGSSVVLTASGASSYTWIPNSALSCTVCTSATANPSISSTYTVTGTNVNGCVNNKTVTVFVNPLPTLTLTPSSATICTGSSTVLSASGASTYSWSPVTGLSCTNCANPTVSITVSTTYTVTGSDVNGCVNTKTVSVMVNPLPVITISPASVTICMGSSTVLTASGGTSYVWVPSTGLSCTNCANPTANPTLTTTYTVSGTNANGCNNTKTVTVSVNPLPVINVTPASATICSGTSVLLNASGAGSYSWSPATGLSCSACSSPTANPSASTIYTVTGTNANGCSNTQTTSVTTNSLPVITISPVSPSICIGSSVVLSATGANSYGWSPATALSCNNCPNPAASPAVNTSYTVTGTAANGCMNTQTITVFVNPLPVISVSPSSATFCIGGSTILSASGANNYSWSPSAGLSCTNCASPSANPTITTTYTVSGNDLNGCVNTKTITITVNPLPVLSINPPTSTICITSSVVLNASGASTYTWVPASGLSCTNCASPTANPASATVYTLTGTSASGCVASKTVFISINPSPTVNVSPSSVTLCAGNSTVLSASGANSYSWIPSAGLSCNNCFNPTASPTITTTYTLTGTDVNGCSNTTTANVIINALPVITTNPISATLCIGSAVTFSASGAASYTWSPAAALSCTLCANPTANPTITTIYTVTGTNANGCINTKTLSVTVNSPPTVSVSPSTSTLCAGGSVVLTASGAINYTWTASAGLSCSTCPSPTANPTITTTYSVTGSNGCTGTSSAVVYVNTALVVTVSPVSATICTGSSVVLNVSGASTYTWGPSSGLSCINCSSPIANPTLATTYSVTGKDNNGCLDTKTVSVFVNSLPVVNINPSSATVCAGSSVTLSASGSSTYIWTPTIGLSCTNCSIVVASPTITTIYTVTGTNSNGCSNTATTSVNVNSTPVLTVTPPSATLCSGGSISLNVFGANSYAWSPINGLSCSGCSNPTASPTITTTYTVTGTDLNGCVNTKSITVTVNPVPLISITPSSATLCIGNNVSLAASGANNYVWIPAAGLSCTNCATTNANPTITTTYSVTGTDLNGCSSTKSISVIINSLPVISINPNTTTLCAGSSATITVSGANTYTWLPNAGLSCSTCSNTTVNPLVTTSYTVSGTDINGCVNSNTTTVSVNSLPVININPASSTLCAGNSVTLTASGANTYNWIPFSGINCNTCPNPIANPTITTGYTVTGTDANGCVNTQTAVVNITPLPVITISPASPAICIGGSIIINASGANAYTWTPNVALSCTNCANPIANPSVTTTYTLFGINANGCVTSKTATVNVNPLPVIAINPSSSTICVGGSASLTASGASSYVWSPSSGLSCTNCAGPIANPSINTNYTITGTDVNGCVNLVTTSVTVNSLPVISVNPSSATLCLGTSTVITASGATTYFWSPFSGLSCNNCPNPTANPTVTTTYTITGTSINGCVNTKTITITISPSLALVVSPNTATLCSGSSIGITASGAVGYFWSPSTGLSCNACANPIASPTITTTYTVTGTAGSGCAGTTTVTINVNPLPAVIITPGSATLCIGNSVSLSASGANNFAWSPATGLSCTNCPNPIANPTNNIIYTVVGTDFNGCSTSQTISVTVNPLPIITSSISPSNTICIGGSATITASGSSSYTWSPPTGISCINCSVTIATPTSNITYTLSGTNTNGCVNTKTLAINVNPLPVISASPVSATICSGNSIPLSASGGNSYTWSPSNGLSCSNCIAPVANPTTSTVYSLIGSDNNGCQNSQTLSIHVNPLPIINVNQATVFLCAGTSTVVSANGANSYTWSPSIGLSCNVCASATATPNSNTTYSVFGSDVNGCVNFNTVNITVDPLPVVTINPNFAIQCAGKSSSITATGASSYVWSPLTGLDCGNCSSVVASPSVTTTYTVIGYTANGCSSTKTIGITVNPLPVISFFPPSATLCIGGSTTVSVSGATNYTWVTSAGLSCNMCNNPILNPTVSTIYSVTAKDANGCVDTKPYSVIIGQPFTASITGDSIICAGTNIILQGLGGTQYNWSNGASTSSTLINPTITTTYTLIATKLGCKDTVLKTITVYSVALANAGPDVTINYGNSINLSGTGGGLYNWSPNNNLSCSSCANPVANPTVSTFYILTVTNNLGCSNSDTVYVNVDKVCGDVFVPNVFSPNGDNQNDVLYVENRCLESIEFMIYNRWGEKVFETTDPKVGWDGTYKGVMLNGGGFVYYLVARLVNRDDLVIKKGNIMILR